jgi:pimeloyl-ACP methyl ester carboxylesterase
MTPSPLQLARNLVYLPWAPIPEGRMVALPGRGTTFVTDTPGPSPDSPTVLLLHALATTGRLCWYPTIPTLATRYRVVTLDLPWHGRGVQSGDFSLRDCADDAVAVLDQLEIERAVVGGYSMGSIVAQRVWRQHPGRVTGLVLGGTTDHFQKSMSERLFHASSARSMRLLRELSRTRAAAVAARTAGRALNLESPDLHAWALDEFRSTSPWAIGQAVAALGRHHSRPWLAEIDVPTAVVIPLKDGVIPPERQFAVARRIPGATVHDFDAGHASVVLQPELFVPAFQEACATVVARARDMARWQR